MKKIALATAALLIGAGAAFAENPNVGGSDYSDQPAIDNSYTASTTRTSDVRIDNSSGPAADGLTKSEQFPNGSVFSK